MDQPLQESHMQLIGQASSLQGTVRWVCVGQSAPPFAFAVSMFFTST
jgi:hypothetical protein